MPKRENDSLALKQLMKFFIKENNLSKGMQKIKIEEAWHKLMGKGVSSYTHSIELQKKTLVIRLTSSVLREELGYGKEKIIKMINEEVGDKVISKLLLV